MDNTITEKSPAKINLFLKILNRREDNYHNIRTGITSINLCDENRGKAKQSIQC